MSIPQSHGVIWSMLWKITFSDQLRCPPREDFPSNAGHSGTKVTRVIVPCSQIVTNCILKVYGAAV